MGISKAVKRDRMRQLIAGIQSQFGKVKSITLKGKDVKLTDLVSTMQASIDAGADTDAKRAVFLEAAQVSRAANEASDPQALAFTEYLQLTMSATDLAAFGLKPRTRTEPDVATKALAVEKRAATRKARGTMGKKEKAKIVGVVNESPAAPASTPNITPTVASAKTAVSTATN